MVALEEKLKNSILILVICLFLSGCSIVQTETDNPADKFIEVLTAEGEYEKFSLSDPFKLDEVDGRETTFDKVQSLYSGVLNSPMFVAIGDGKIYTVYGAQPKGTIARGQVTYEVLSSKDILLEVRNGKLVYTYDKYEYDNDTVFSIKTVKDKNLTLLGFMLTEVKKEEV